MASVTLFLLNQTNAKRRVELGLQKAASFKKENLTLVITLFFFSVSYGLRFAYDGFLVAYLFNKELVFALDFVYAIIFLFEGTTFMAILLYHNQNFKVRKPVNDLTEQQIAEADSHSIDDSEALVYLQTSFVDDLAGHVLEQDSVILKEEEEEAGETQVDQAKKNCGNP